MIDLTEYGFEVAARAPSAEAVDPGEAAEHFIEAMEKKLDASGIGCDMPLDGEGTAYRPFEIGVSHMSVFISLKVWNKGNDVYAKLELSENDEYGLHLKNDTGLEVKLKPGPAGMMIKEFLAKTKADAAVEAMHKEIADKVAAANEALKIVSFFGA